MIVHETVAPVALRAAEIADLANRVTGPVLMPGDVGYQAECATFNLMSPVRPAVAVGVASVGDVQAAVRFAAERDMPITVLATGHQMVRSAAGAVLVNMSRMNAIRIDPAQRVARAEGGTRWREVLNEADKHGLASASGSSPTVGVVGYHLGGGASPILGRRYGYAADHIQAIEIVTADGGLRWVTASSEPDLFWALRGGKGNFGVVTALEFRLFPVKRFYGGGLFFAGEHAAKVLHTWREWLVDLPTDTSSSVAFLRRSPLPEVPEFLRGTFVMHLRFSSLRAPEEAERVLAPMRKIAPTVMDTIAELPYREAGSLFLDPPTPVPWVERAAMLRDLPSEAVDAMLSVLGTNSDTRLGFVELRLLGGALGRPPAVPDAVPGRSGRWSLFASGGGRPDLAPVLQEQLIALLDAMRPWVQDEIVPNLLSAHQGTTPENLRAIYGRERYDRLVAIKRQYDPRNLFRMNHNIVDVARAENDAQRASSDMAL
ncbi:FAD-binding oxidoreductase [Bradyrhizobium sp. Leo121]|uniref:FAD-binding oxidoreductase n=1 Tax=Bradyrhizobium sp. Leo121 TaxID=1571195 RepID=UPI00102940C9|nr:FAD-binding oxidoreductase [Bradyrhizobium sp. Leo121]RZN33742.1 FAD-dependent oxygenase [Bradyrhizobium sp. Leo121]